MIITFVTMKFNKAILPLFIAANCSIRFSEAFSVSRHVVSLRDVKARPALLAKADRKFQDDIRKKVLIDQGTPYIDIKEAIEKMEPSAVTPNGEEVQLTRGSQETKEEYNTNHYNINPENLEKLSEMSRAQEEFLKLGQEDADRIFNAIAQAANFQRLPLAKLAAQETGMGCLEDKVLKNGLACELIHDRYKDAKTCGLILEDSFHGLKTYAHPVVRERQ